jgi:hypothetical protein
MFSNADLSLAAGRIRKKKMARAASGMILQSHKRLLVSIFAALGFLKQLLECFQN